jgi:hypothetical protein
MCFETTKSAKAKIADKDIECWKIVKVDNRPIYQDQNPPYEIGKRNPDVKIEPYWGSIDRGYHSFRRKIKNVPYIYAGSYLRDHPECIKKFIIPKGTRYYSNRTQYVSETIMLVE